MQPRIVLIVGVLYLLAGCTTRGTALPTPDVAVHQLQSVQAENQHLRDQLAARERELTAEHDRNNQLQAELTAEHERGAATAIPPFVYEALARQAYSQLQQGQKPAAMLEPGSGGQFFIRAKGYAPMNAPFDGEADWALLLKWAQAQSAGGIRAIHHLPSQPGYHAMDLDLPDGFYARVIFHGYYLDNFMVADEPMGMT